MNEEWQEGGLNGIEGRKGKKEKRKKGRKKARQEEQNGKSRMRNEGRRNGIIYECKQKTTR